MNRGLAIALAASLAANVFLGGFVAGRLFNAPPPKPVAEAGERPLGERQAAPPGVDGRPDRRAFAGGGPLGGFGLTGADLPPEARAVLRETLRERRGDFRRDRIREQRLRAALRKALDADEFDRDAVEQAMTEMAEFHSARQKRFSAFLIDFFESLPAEERKAILERSAERFDRRRGFGRGAPPDPENDEERSEIRE